MLGCAARAVSAAPIDPILRFQTIETRHFSIHFHQGEERLAQRLATIAEDVWQKVGDAFHVVAPARTQVIIANQSELAAGWATPLPYNTIYVSASAPSGAEFIGRTEDWLRLVFTHEFTHIVHLNGSFGWARVMRAMFGRTALAFPNLFLPTWQIEGLATWEESALGGEGRLRAADFRAIEREAARGGRVDSLDRINGGLTDWPNGLAPYAFGLGLHEYLADRFGEEAFARLSRETARSLPYAGSRAFRTVYGESFGSLWSRYVERLTARVAPVPGRDLPVPRRLTRHGYAVLGPRFAPRRCPDCPSEIMYSMQGPDGFPALRSIRQDGSRGVQLATRYLGSTSAPGPEFVVFDQQEIRRNAGLYSDLFVFDRTTRRVRQLTREARLRDPDLSPDGRTLICVREANGIRDLVLVQVDSLNASNDRRTRRGHSTFGDISVLRSEADAQFDAPRWSPDGRFIVAERHRLNRLSEIVLVEVGTGAVHSVTGNSSARFATPTWRPDGQAVIAAVQHGDQTFNLYELSVTDPERPARQLTSTTGGATWPDVSADGETIVFVGYTPDGSDLFTVPYALSDSPAAVLESGDRPLSTAALDHRTLDTSRRPAVHAYAPGATLLPTAWTPVVEGAADRLRAGLAVSGTDVLARHNYALTATWLMSAPASALAPPRARPDWQAFYRYTRRRPTLFLSASSETIFGAGPADARGRPSSATLRQRDVQAGVLVPMRHVREEHRALFSVVGGSSEYTLDARQASLARASLRAAWASNTSHTYGYSISPERGVSLGTTAELTRQALGASADASVWTADLRTFLPGAADHHVIAVRAAGGSSAGRPDLGRIFHLGGAAPSGDVISFDRDAFSLLRGFPSDAFAGTNVALVNAEYRWPIARPQRGVGTWPLFLHTVHASVFTDAGHVWTDGFRWEKAKLSAGAELASDVVAGYSWPFTVAIGAAWGRDRARPVDRHRTVYVRIGRSF